MSYEDKSWMEEAICVKEKVHPEHFDTFDYFICRFALEVCVPCPVKLQCLQQVDPAQNFFDGVAGGIAWRDGRIHRVHPRGQEPLRHHGIETAQPYLRSVKKGALARVAGQTE